LNFLHCFLLWGLHRTFVLLLKVPSVFHLNPDACDMVHWETVKSVKPPHLNHISSCLDNRRTEFLVTSVLLFMKLIITALQEPLSQPLCWSEVTPQLRVLRFSRLYSFPLHIPSEGRLNSHRCQVLGCQRLVIRKPDNCLGSQ